MRILKLVTGLTVCAYAIACTPGSSVNVDKATPGEDDDEAESADGVWQPLVKKRPRTPHAAPPTAASGTGTAMEVADTGVAGVGDGKEAGDAKDAGGAPKD